MVMATAAGASVTTIADATAAMATVDGIAVVTTVDGIDVIMVVDATGMTTEIPGAKTSAKQYVKQHVITWLHQMIPIVTVAGRAFLSRPIRY